MPDKNRLKELVKNGFEKAKHQASVAREKHKYHLRRWKRKAVEKAAEASQAGKEKIKEKALQAKERFKQKRQEKMDRDEFDKKLNRLQEQVSQAEQYFP